MHPTATQHMGRHECDHTLDPLPGARRGTGTPANPPPPPYRLPMRTTRSPQPRPWTSPPRIRRYGQLGSHPPPHPSAGDSPVLPRNRPH